VIHSNSKENKNRNLTRRSERERRDENEEGLLFVLVLFLAIDDVVRTPELTLLPRRNCSTKTEMKGKAKGAKMCSLLFTSRSLWLCTLLLPIHRQNTQILNLMIYFLLAFGSAHKRHVDEGENAKKDDNKFLLRMRFLCLSLSPPLLLCGFVSWLHHPKKKNRSNHSFFSRTCGSLTQISKKEKRFLRLLENTEETQKHEGD
jgi:hypothetical protein